MRNWQRKTLPQPMQRSQECKILCPHSFAKQLKQTLFRAKILEIYGAETPQLEKGLKFVLRRKKSILFAAQIYRHKISEPLLFSAQINKAKQPTRSVAMQMIFSMQMTFSSELDSLSPTSTRLVSIVDGNILKLP